MAENNQLNTPFGTNVRTALGVNVGSAGAVIVNGGVLGTPSSGTLSGCSGLPISGISATGTPGAGNFLRGDGTWSAASSATSIAITDDTTTNATMYPVWVNATSGALVPYVSSSKFAWNPSTGVISAAAWGGSSVKSDFGGTGQTSYTLGDTLYYSSGTALSRLAGNTTTTQLFLAQTGDGINSAAPSWVNIGTTITWNNVTSTPVSAVKSNGYVVSHSAIVDFTLPATCTYGDTVTIQGSTATGWRLYANSGQTIAVTSAISTATAGYLKFADRYDSVKVVCVVPNTTWAIESVNSGGLLIDAEA